MPRDIDEWLEELGLSRYAPAFAEQEIVLRDVVRLTEANLKEMGLPIGPRRQLLAALAELSEDGATASATTGVPMEASAAEERRQLMVLFCDLVGSTALSQKLDSEDFRDVIRSFQEAYTGAVHEHEGFVAKHLGDGLLAYFGWDRRGLPRMILAQGRSPC